MWKVYRWMIMFYDLNWILKSTKNWNDREMTDLKIKRFWFALSVIVMMGCDYFEPIEPENLHSPWPIRSEHVLPEYLTYEIDSIIIRITEHDLENACAGRIFHWSESIPSSHDFGQTIHLIAHGLNLSDFARDVYITIPYNIQDFSFETVYTDLFIYKYDLLDLSENSILNLDDFEMMPVCQDNKENHTVTVRTNSLQGRYIIVRPR